MRKKVDYSEEEIQRMVKKQRQTIVNRYGVVDINQADFVKKKMIEPKEIKCCHCNKLFIGKKRDKDNYTSCPDCRISGLKNKSDHDRKKFLDIKKEVTCFHCGSKVDGKLYGPNKVVCLSCKKKGLKSPVALKSRKKYKETMMIKYGVKNYGELSECHEKKRKPKEIVCCYCSKKFVGKVNDPNYFTCCPDCRKIGLKNPIRTPDAVQKSIKTLTEKYGVINVSQLDEVKKKKRDAYIKTGIPKILNKLSILNLEITDPEYKNAVHTHHFRCLICKKEFEQNWFSIQQGFLCPNCYPRNSGYSAGEKEVCEFIRSLGIENIIENDRRILNGRELDIVIPDKNIAIEYNGLYYHSDVFCKDPKYHLRKTLDCEKEGIRLIQIFEDEWLFKRDIVKSRLKQILNFSTNLKKIDARNCVVKIISSKEKNNFLTEYHIQGSDFSSINLGCYYEDLLVSVMTFSKPNIAKGSRNQDGIFELNRFCNDYNYLVRGTFGKLLEYFKRNFEWKRIYSYADRRWSDGGIYEKLGFTSDKKSRLNYWYVKEYKRIHRYSLRKRHDEPKEISERLLRLEEGYSIIWDCGNLKFELSNNQ